jgi:glycosyltransferase involved in cell wall biosynthesis
MKILQANKFFFLNGGSETVMFQEREFLLKNNHQVFDFSMYDARNIESEQSNYFIENRTFRFGGAGNKINQSLQIISFIHSPEAVRNITNLIIDKEPDLVHCHNIYHQLTPSIIGAAKKLGVPVVLTLHDYKPVCPVYTRVRDGVVCSECLNGNFSRVVKNRCADGSLGKSALLYVEALTQKLMGNYEKVAAFIAPSQFMKQSISHRISSDRVHLLHNGIAVDTIEISSEDDGYVLFMGRLVAEKGIETLLKAHQKSNGAWALKVAGAGPLMDVLKAQYNPSIFVGYLAGDALKDIIQKASVIVIPSEWYENCPMSVLEAMAYGKPVVGSHMGGIPELVQDNITGLLFEAGNVHMLANQINRLITDPPLRKQMGAAGRKRVERYFSLGTHNAELMNIYNKVLGA